MPGPGSAQRLESKSWKTYASTPLHPLGYIHRESANHDNLSGGLSDGDQRPVAESGESEWIYIYNDSGSTLSAGLLFSRKTTTKTLAGGIIGGTGTTRYNALGFAQWDIPTGKYSFIQRRGRGLVQSNGTASADVPMVPAAAGQVTSSGLSTREHQLVGQFLEANASASTNAEAHIDCTSAA